MEPYYFNGKRGRLPMGIAKMLRMYLLQIWFSLSDEGVENAIYDSYAMRKFMGIDFMEEQVPDATTLLNFHHLKEESGLGKAFFDAAINRCLERCHMMKDGTVVDATIINAPSSTENATGSRDPEMCQTKKGNFGMKCHMGIDAGTSYIHSLEATAANVYDVAEAAKLIRPDDEVIYGDAEYLGIQKRLEIVEDERMSSIDYRISIPEKSWNWRKVLPETGFGTRNTGNPRFVPRPSTRFILSRIRSVLARSATMELPKI